MSGPKKQGRLVVVSNRVALPQQTATGGLASAMRVAMRERGGLWFGWSGKISADSSRVQRTQDGAIDYATIDLTRTDHDEFYAGFANRALWPLLHYRPDLVDYQRGQLDGYLRVNALFADYLIELLKPDDVIWVHDYHLIPLAARLRERGVKNRNGFFLHTPLPAAGLLIGLPQHRALFETLAAYDLIGVHTARDLRALEEYFLHEIGGAMRPGGRIRAAQELADRHACAVLLKGSGTVIAQPREVPLVNPTGSAALATHRRRDRQTRDRYVTRCRRRSAGRGHRTSSRSDCPRARGHRRRGPPQPPP